MTEITGETWLRFRVSEHLGREAQFRTVMPILGDIEEVMLYWKLGGTAHVAAFKLGVFYDGACSLKRRTHMIVCSELDRDALIKKLHDSRPEMHYCRECGSWIPDRKQRERVAAAEEAAKSPQLALPF